MEANKICNCVHGAGQIFVNPKVRLALGLSEELPKLTLAQTLEEIRKSLTEETWIKEKYFNSGAAKAMARAAAAAVAASVAAAGVGVAARTAEIGKKQDRDLITLWNNRPKYYSEDHGYGSRDIHFLMGMFGLTASFNDASSTTLAMVHEKLIEASNWARENNL